jgi:hypothetical protein
MKSFSEQTKKSEPKQLLQESTQLTRENYETGYHYITQPNHITLELKLLNSKKRNTIAAVMGLNKQNSIEFY